MKKIDIDALCTMTKLKFEGSERAAIEKSLEKSLAFISMIEGFNPSGAVEVEARPYSNFRDDVVMPSLSIDEAMRNAPQSRDRCFVVPLVVE
jgi:aspartyl/glutamyl-tRNA(Asn/Gln) amidotransferase C subunit